jgi:purine-binding chemotaxis protein CheW
MYEQASTRPQGEKGQYLTFRLGADDYAVDILRVQEIRGWEKVRSLPDSEAHVKGVLDLRGTIVPIVDLRIRFGETEPEYSATTVVIVMAIDLGESQQHLVGAVVDGVSDVLDIDRTELKPPPNIGGTVSRRYLEGMVSLPRGMVILLDLDRLFNPDELSTLRDLAGD